MARLGLRAAPGGCPSAGTPSADLLLPAVWSCRKDIAVNELTLSCPVIQPLLKFSVSTQEGCTAWHVQLVQLLVIFCTQHTAHNAQECLSDHGTGL